MKLSQMAAANNMEELQQVPELQPEVAGSVTDEEAAKLKDLAIPNKNSTPQPKQDYNFSVEEQEELNNLKSIAGI